MLSNWVKFCIDNKVVVGVLLLGLTFWGWMHMPFDYGIEGAPRDPVAVDAIPNIGENQQIVFTDWPGRSPQDIEDQITYPLTTALLGVPGVKEVRSNSMFGFSSIYVIFEEGVEFYWSRSRLLEKLNSLPEELLPDGVQPALGPDATALGQIFWYTLEGRDPEGNPTGGWDLHEIRSVQDFQVKYALAAVPGVAEVASVGGFVQEYQVDVDPQKLQRYNLSLMDVRRAIASSNLDVGAQTVEINQVEYFVRGLGYVEQKEDIGNSVVRKGSPRPILVRDVARVSLGPAQRRGALDKSGAEVAGGVVVAAHGSNPNRVITDVKSAIDQVAPSLPTKTLEDGTKSQLTIVPFYDRTELIAETIGTLEEALILQIIITTIVILLLLFNLRASAMVAGLLPVAVLFCFIAMKWVGIEANIVALTGIAIAIGTMVDMAIVLVESIVNRLEDPPPGESLRDSILEATGEVGGAVTTAVATTVISFLPVFSMIGAEGKMFTPLAYTKTFALIAAIVLTLFVIPPLAHILFRKWKRSAITTIVANGLLVALGIYGMVQGLGQWPGLVLLVGLAGWAMPWVERKFSGRTSKIARYALIVIYALWVAYILAHLWMPLGLEQSLLVNLLFIGLIIGGFWLFFTAVIRYYEQVLQWLLRYAWLFFIAVGLLLYGGYRVYSDIGTEFLPDLDEGSFLLMPTTMPHAGMEENMRNLRLLDMAVSSIPEVKTVVGKLGRAESPLDPAPTSMFENVILYEPEYKLDKKGRRIRFQKNEDGTFARDEKGELIPDPGGRYYRNWRSHIESPDDIWNEIVQASKMPGLTSAPKLQPIETRLVMLQSGMRAPMGIKVRGPDLETISEAAAQFEDLLKDVEGVKTSAVFAERVVGKPYLNIDIDRDALAVYGLSVEEVQDHIRTALGGSTVSQTVEGRERYAIRLRYPRELRNHPEKIKEVLIKAGDQVHIPLKEVAAIEYERGPQSIKSENGFLVSYVLFDKEEGYSEGEVVEFTKSLIDERQQEEQLNLPQGVSFEFAGNYQQQERANRRLAIAVPVALALIFLILYLQFRSSAISLMVFSGVLVAFAGGFLMLGLYNTDWFLNFSVFGTSMRELFQVNTMYLSVAVWVGFLALFGIATDDGVLVATFLRDSFRKREPESVEELRKSVIEGGLRRVRPAMMTTATTLLALLPVLSSTGKGADVMIPMAIPTFGGMAIQIVTMFTVPILFYLWKVRKIKKS